MDNTKETSVIRYRKKLQYMLLVYQHIVLRISNLGLSVLYYKKLENLYASLQGENRGGGELVDRPLRNILCQESYD